MPSLSVILPAYNEEAMLPKTAKVLAQVLESENIDYELVFVDDGSKDLTWSEILTAHQANERVHGVHFSRNFGKEAAIFAGLAAAKGDCAAVMDCDLQHHVLQSDVKSDKDRYVTRLGLQAARQKSGEHAA